MKEWTLFQSLCAACAVFYSLIFPLALIFLPKSLKPNANGDHLAASILLGIVFALIFLADKRIQNKQKKG